MARGGVRHLVRAALLGALAAASGAVPTVAQAASGSSRSVPGRLAEVRVGSVPALPAGTRLLAAVDAARSLRITVVLAPRSPRALAAEAASVSDPLSAGFRRYLGVAAFRARFAPSAETVAWVRAALQAAGLRPGPLSANGLSIPVQASAGAVEAAFRIALETVRLPDGSTATVTGQAPALPRAVAPEVQAVLGLSSLGRPEPLLVRPRASAVRPAGAARVTDATGRARPAVATGGPQPCASARDAAPDQDAYTADEIASAYDFSGLYRAGDLGAGETVALYELEPDAPSDIATFQSCYGTHASVSYVAVDGGAGSGPGSGEAALDIEQIISLAPRANVLVYQGPNSSADGPGSAPYDLYSVIAGQDRAKIVSTSWGQCEASLGASAAQAENTLFEEMAIQGQSVFAASGDDGSEDCNGETAAGGLSLAVDDPASQPFVTGAGGTSLTALGPPPTESVWNNAGNAVGLLPGGLMGGAGGGGISSFWGMPTYQSDAAGALGVVGARSSGLPCGASHGDCREVPDVSASADPEHGYLIYYNGSGSDATEPSGWQGIGGTSAAAPLWAALSDLADASTACRGATIGFANPALYRAAATGEGTIFHDITTGDNDETGAQRGEYPATTGYDMASGLGTPDAARVAAALCADSLRLLSPGNRRTVRRRKVDLRLRVIDVRGAGVQFASRGLPRGLKLNARTGRVTGRPTRLGTFHVIVTVSTADDATRAISFLWRIVRHA